MSDIESGVLWRRRWHWDEVSVISWDRHGSATFVALCLWNDPTPRLMEPGWWGLKAIRDQLGPIRPFAEEMGVRVVDSDEPASAWWYRWMRNGWRVGPHDPGVPRA